MSANDQSTASRLRLSSAAQKLRECPTHGRLNGVRYCPECASVGKPWTEAQADEADRLAVRCEFKAPLTFRGEIYALLNGGEVRLQWPEPMDADSLAFIEEHLKQWVRKMKRRIDSGGDHVG